MVRLTKSRVLAVTLWVGVLILAGVGYWRTGLGRAASLESFGAAPAFALTDQLDRPVTLDDFRGKVIVANFIYTNCRDICPLLSFRMQQLQERLRSEGLLGSRVQLLSFTVDPAHDTPAVLRDYGAKHQADVDAWRFLTGPPDQVVPLIVDGFHLGVVALPPPDTGQDQHGSNVEAGGSSEVMHSGRFVLIDRRGQIRAYYDGTVLDLDQVVRDVRRLLG
jgi:cytochrome oxidase Cu insertion factor (SCO1/SenC/PrrC family)